MKRSAMTLVELLVSLILFGLIATFLYGAIDQIRGIHTYYGEKSAQLSSHERIRALLYRDLAQGGTITIGGNDLEYNVVSLQNTRNSLYGNANAHIVWLVLKNKNTLIRIESADSVQLPIDPVKLYGAHFDHVAQGCKSFRVYGSDKGYFARVLCGEDEIMVEVPR
ncbi:MAG: prepilin-type N-terminal cleavage/methylation domain-containing protein [Sulfuricurvum sp.]|nr:prepilin-type N-terminal cleavage/methylation domain-containing protein [Sulfuricurvum sp.]